jgi:hypothetical protein
MLTKRGFHVLMIVEASQNSGSKYLTIKNSKLIVEICFFFFDCVMLK